MPSAVFKIVTTSLLMLSLFILVSCSSKNNVQAKQASLYFGAGTQSLMAKNYTEALTSLIKANELDPDNAEILNNLGMAYYFKGEKDLAVKHLNKALEINKDNSDAKNNLASIYFKAGNIALAERLYQEVLKDLTYDKQARTFYNLAMIEMQAKKNNSTAEVYFKKSIKEDESFCPSYFQLGIIQYGRKQFNGALKNFKEASMGTCYESPAPHFYQALALIQTGKIDEARIKLDEVESRFKKSVFAVKARTKSLELNEMQVKPHSEARNSSQNVYESPEF